METISINTTQNIALDFEIASVGDRILATIIDYVVRIAWAVLCVLLLRKADDSGIVLILIAALPFVLYHLAMEIFFNGQSLGKMAMNIKVIKMDGNEPNLGAYLLRWLIRIVDLNMFSGLVAVIAVVVNGKGQRLGDMAAGTTVISLKKRVQLQDTIYTVDNENYLVTFNEATNLSDTDAVKIKMVFNEAMKKQQYQIIDELAEKVKQTLNINTSMASEEFLRTLMRDYNHLMSEM